MRTILAPDNPRDNLSDAQISNLIKEFNSLKMNLLQDSFIEEYIANRNNTKEGTKISKPEVLDEINYFLEVLAFQLDFKGYYINEADYSLEKFKSKRMLREKELLTFSDFFNNLDNFKKGVLKLKLEIGFGNPLNIWFYKLWSSIIQTTDIFKYDLLFPSLSIDNNIPSNKTINIDLIYELKKQSLSIYKSWESNLKAIALPMNFYTHLSLKKELLRKSEDYVNIVFWYTNTLVLQRVFHIVEDIQSYENNINTTIERSNFEPITSLEKIYSQKIYDDILQSRMKEE